MKKIILLFVLFTFLFSCKKSVDKFRYKMSGIWHVEYAKMEFFSNQQNTPDSIREFKNLGGFLLKDGGENYGRLSYYFAPEPHYPILFTDYFNSWDIESSPAKRLTIWKETEFVTITPKAFYTIINFKRNKMVLQYVIPDNIGNNLSYKETIELTR